MNPTDFPLGPDLVTPPGLAVLLQNGFRFPSLPSSSLKETIVLDRMLGGWGCAIETSRKLVFVLSYHQIQVLSSQPGSSYPSYQQQGIFTLGGDVPRLVGGQGSSPSAAVQAGFRALQVATEDPALAYDFILNACLSFSLSHWTSAQ